MRVPRILRRLTRRGVTASAVDGGSIASVEQLVSANGFFLLKSAFSLNPEVARTVDGLFVHALQIVRERALGLEGGLDQTSRDEKRDTK